MSRKRVSTLDPAEAAVLEEIKVRLVTLEEGARWAQ